MSIYYKRLCSEKKELMSSIQVKYKTFGMIHLTKADKEKNECLKYVHKNDKGIIYQKRKKRKQQNNERDKEAWMENNLDAIEEEGISKIHENFIRN